MPTDNLNGHYLAETEAEWELSAEIERLRTNFCHRCGWPNLVPHNGGRRWGYRLRAWKCQRCKATRPAEFDPARLDLAFLLEDAPLHTEATPGKVISWAESGELQTVQVVKSATAKWVATTRAAVMACLGSYNGEIPVIKQLHEWAEENGVSRVYMTRRLGEFGVYPVYHKHVTIYSSWQLDGLPLSKMPRPRITPALEHISKQGDGWAIEHVYGDDGIPRVYNDWNTARETARIAHVLHAPQVPQGAAVEAAGVKGVAITPLLRRSAGAHVKANKQTRFFLRKELIYNGKSMAIRRGGRRKSAAGGAGKRN